MQKKATYRQLMDLFKEFRPQQIFLFLMIRMNVTFGFMILGVSAVYYFFMTYVNGKMRTAFREQQKGVAGLTQSLSEKIRAEYDIIVLDKQQYFAEKFEHQVMREFFEKVKKVIFVEVLNGALVM